MTGKFADAPMQKANDTKKDTFKFCANSAKMMDKIAMPMEPKRAAATSCPELNLPSLMICP